MFLILITKLQIQSQKLSTTYIGLLKQSELLTYFRCITVVRKMLACLLKNQSRVIVSHLFRAIKLNNILCIAADCLIKKNIIQTWWNYDDNHHQWPFFRNFFDWDSSQLCYRYLICMLKCTKIDSILIDTKYAHWNTLKPVFFIGRESVERCSQFLSSGAYLSNLL